MTITLVGLIKQVFHFELEVTTFINHRLIFEFFKVTDVQRKQSIFKRKM